MSRSRDRVIDTALHLFSDRGFNAVSMRDLAEALQMQAPSIYSHFDSKDALLVAVVGPFIEAVHELLDRIPAAPASHADRHAWLTEAVTLLAAHPWELQLVTNDRNLAHHPMFGPQLWAIRTAMIECMTRFGVADPEWAIGVTGALIYTLLPRGDSPQDPSPKPVELSRVVRMAEAFLDAH